MYARLTLLAASAVAGLTLAAATATAQTTYNFGSVQGQVTPLTLDGATFSSPSDPGAFTFGPNGGLFSTLGSYVLSSGGVPATLDIAFSQAQSGISFDFATADFLDSNGSDTLTLVTNTGFSETVGAAIPNGSGDLYPQGTFSLSGASPFTSVAISTADALGPEALVVADLTSQPAVVPLPGALWLFGSGLLALGARTRRVRRAS